MSKILNVIYTNTYGGGETLLQTIFKCAIFDRDNIIFLVIGSVNGEFQSNLESMGYTVYWQKAPAIEFSRGWNYYFLSFCFVLFGLFRFTILHFNILRKCKIIHSHEPRCFLALIPYCAITGTKIIFHAHGFSSLTRSIFIRFGAFFPNSVTLISVSNKLQETLGFSKCTHLFRFVLPNCIDLSEWKPIKVNRHDAKVFLNVGRWIDVKRQSEIIDCFLKVKEQFSEIKLKILTDKVPPIFCGLEEKGVFFVCGANKNAVKKEYYEADFFVFFSDEREGFAIVLLEAMASGLPIISSHVGLMEEIDYGLKIEVNDKNGLTSAMTNCLNNPAFCQRLASQSETIVSEYDCGNIAKKLKGIYNFIEKKGKQY